MLYVPRFEILVNDTSLHEKGSDVVSVQFADSVTALSTFELVLNNWDDGGKSGTPGFKYSNKLDWLVPHAQISLSMGYADGPPPRLMMIGEITAIEPQFPASGAPTITIRGLDRLHRMRNNPKSTSWDGKTDSEIATEIARRNGLTIGHIEPTQTRHKNEQQPNTDDIEYLLERAKKINFEVFMQEDRFFFVLSREGRTDPSLTFEWGKNLGSFTPSLTFADQVTKLTVHGWDHIAQKPIDVAATRDADGSVTASEIEEGSETTAGSEGGKTGGKEEVVTTEEVHSVEEAKNLAKALLENRSQIFVTGGAQTYGMPLLRAGANVTFHGLGDVFNGNYYVIESTHRIDESGYQTTFNVRKRYRALS